MEVYSRTESTWEHTQTLTPDDGSGLGGFGSEPAVESDTAMIAGDTGILVLSLRNTEWEPLQKPTPDAPPTAITIEGDTAFVGSSIGRRGTPYDGRVFVYQRDGSGWNLTQVLEEVGRVFGRVLALGDDVALVAAPQARASPDVWGAGIMYSFGRDGSTWRRNQTLVANDRSPFGFSVRAWR